jgi:hypothetical protein
VKGLSKVPNLKFLFAILLPFLFCQFVLAQPVLLPKFKEKKKKHKDDWVVLDNGDRITGEIKKMLYGMLYIKSTRAIGTLQLDWKKIQRIQSKGRYEFELTDGKLYVGIILPDPEMQTPPGILSLQLQEGSTFQCRIQDVIEIREMQQSFLGRLSLSLDAGITFTKGNNQRQTNVNSTLEYSRPKRAFRIDVQSLFSNQSGATKTSRHSLFFTGERYVSAKWSTLGLLGLLHDNQLDLDLRSTIGGGFRRSFVKRTRTVFTGIAGAVYTREKYVSESKRNNGEFITGLSISTYRFRSSELVAYGFVFPSFTTSGRVRADLSVYWKWEIIKDLYWNVSFWDNFDNHPPVDSLKNNFGISSSVGWTF